MKVSLSGGIPVAVGVGEPFVWSIAADETDVYWMSSGTRAERPLFSSPDGMVVKAPLVGRGSTTLASGVDSTPFPTNITVDTTSVYWIDHGSRSIMKVSKSGGTPTTVVTMR
jgi:hypothetical protein